MFTKVLVPLDHSALAEQAIGQAAAIARASHADMDLVFVHQLMPFGGFADEPWNFDSVSFEDRYLASIAKEIKTGAAVNVTHTVLVGEATEMICRRARERGSEEPPGGPASGGHGKRREEHGELRPGGGATARRRAGAIADPPRESEI